MKPPVSRLLLAWYRAGHRDLPWRRVSDPYRIWVSEVMLQQTRAQAAIPYYQRFIERFPTVAALASAGEEEVLTLWSGLGYYARARNLLRAARQEMLAKPGAPRLWTVIDEAALRRPIGGPAVMRAQLARLIEATEEPGITVQVVPFGSGGHAAEGGAFTIMRFPETELPDVVYVEQLTSALYLDKRDDVEKYSEVMDRLSVESEPPERTADMLGEIIARDFS